MKASKSQKNNSTVEMLGCSIIEYKTYIEDQFKEGMTWDNYGVEWHVDHIIPLAVANSPKELESLFHYSNTQPLWAKENLSKGSEYNGKVHKFNT